MPIVFSACLTTDVSSSFCAIVAVVALVGLRGLEVARLPLDDDRLHLQRSHLRARAAARVAGLGPGHDRARQHQVLARARDVDHRQIARPRAAEVLRDPLAQVDVVEADDTARASTNSISPPSRMRSSVHAAAAP